ncbi:MAG: capsule assembly Wzi family protein [Bacteroidetes bacterium]|nr:capsule assembly Wzi family protein [Bacteroidota bacterium]
MANGILTHHKVTFDFPYKLPGFNNSESVLYGNSTGDDPPRFVSETSVTPSKHMKKFLVQSYEGAVNELVSMLNRQFPLIEAIVANGGIGQVLIPKR